MLRTILYPILMILAAALAYGQDEQFSVVKDEDLVKKQFERHAQQFHSLQCAFNQSKYISYLSASVNSEGIFYMKNKNNIRWEYKEPFQYKVIVANGAVKLDNSNAEFKNQKNKYFDYINKLLPEVLSGNFNSSEEFSISILEDETQYLLQLDPKNPQVKEIISGINLLFNKQNYILNSIRIKEPTNDYTLITFQEQKINPVLPDSLFR